MPIYEYQCARCGEFEFTQRITDDPLKRCPTCRGKVRKLISNTSFQLKGSGWYVTDYGRKGGGAGKEARGSNGDGAAPKNADASASESSGAEKTSEKKTEKKTEKKGTAAKAA